MKKVLSFFLLLFLAGGFIFSESIRDTDEYKKMMELKTKYDEAYEAGDYDTAMKYAQDIRVYVDKLNQMADDRLGIVSTPSTPTGDFVQYYVVKEGDCFWTIAAKGFIYSDPFKWKAIYNLNKNKLVNPSNPWLIHPGMTFEIPSLNGEVRSGTK